VRGREVGAELMSENENSPPLSSPQDPNDELVVCLPADAVRQLMGPGFTPTMATSTTPANKRVLEELDSMPVTSMSLSLAETDERHLHLIAYCVISHKGRVATYRRGKGSSETRLAEKRSIGFGGHVCTTDNRLSFVRGTDAGLSLALKKVAAIAPSLGDVAQANSTCSGPLACATVAANRELAEELGLFIDECRFDIVGIVRDDSDAVGLVHLGIVFSVELDDAEAAALVAHEEEVSQLQFEDLDKVRADAASFEKWSTAILQSP
jgi:predicted NUDIX family phosphoesterase